MRSVWKNPDYRQRIIDSIHKRKDQGFPRTCVVCSTDFVSKGGHAKYCSNACKRIQYGLLGPLKPVQKNRHFKPKQFAGCCRTCQQRLPEDRRYFCSDACGLAYVAKLYPEGEAK